MFANTCPVSVVYSLFRHVLPAYCHRQIRECRLFIGDGIHWMRSDEMFLLSVEELLAEGPPTRPFSLRLVIMTMTPTFCCQIILQKSSLPARRGP